MKHYIVFTLLSVLWAGCRQESQEAASEIQQTPLTVTFSEQEYTGNKTPYEGDTLAAEISFRYPVFSGGDSSVTQKINSYLFCLMLDDYFSEPDTETQNAKTLEEVAQRFFKEAKDSEIADYPRASAWTFGFDTDTLLLDPVSKRLTLIHNYSTYTGGAHPNYAITISNIDLATGDTLSNGALFGQDNKLLTAVKNRFIENEKRVMAEEGFPFDMANYWFDDGFKLPQAMGFTREGIQCYYSPYEVAPYARGVIDFLVPYSEVPHLRLKSTPKNSKQAE